jgi:hypothetical protein
LAKKEFENREIEIQGFFKKPFPRNTHRTWDLAAVVTLTPLFLEKTLVSNGFQ